MNARRSMAIGVVVARETIYLTHHEKSPGAGLAANSGGTIKQRAGYWLLELETERLSVVPDNVTLRAIVPYDPDSNPTFGLAFIGLLHAIELDGFPPPCEYNFLGGYIRQANRREAQAPTSRRAMKSSVLSAAMVGLPIHLANGFESGRRGDRQIIPCVRLLFW